MSELAFSVEGYPPAKSEALSMLGAGHPHLPRVRALREAAHAAAAASERESSEALTASVGLELVLHVPTAPPSDATNYLGGVADVLESKKQRGTLEQLGSLAHVALFANDRQIQEVRYRCEAAEQPSYTVRLWTL